MQQKSESAEAEFMYQYEAAAPESLGVTAVRLAGGVALHMRHDPISYWSKALGFTETVTPELVERILDFYRSCDATTAVLQFAPHVLPDSFTDLAAEVGLEEAGSIVKLGCATSDVKIAKTDFRITRVAESDAAEWGEVILKSFGAPGTPLSEMVANSVSNPDFHGFAAWDGDTMVAGGNLLVHGDVGSINTGGTLPEYRGRGAQSALIAARAQAAHEAGCRWVVAETGVPEPGQSNRSLNNLRRAGLQDLYQRQDWRWTEKGL
ncbi:GNAT family N-acetyltransferase [Lentzea sp. NPDC051213]|uniref:GNAT family N-acetyltransferase n=1 Tax=Lentzea sp. NPDC051213 TaxID=3364126 RepID=UPI0037B7125F